VFLIYPCGPFLTITRVIESALYLHLTADEKFDLQSKIIPEDLFYCNDWYVFDLLVTKPDAKEYII